MNANKKLVTILSIDGGGIRGIIPGQILNRLEEKIQHISGNPDARLAEYFDLVAGTSTGGILSCIYLLPDPKNPQKPAFKAIDAVNLYSQNGRRIFSPTLGGKILYGIFEEKYKATEMQRLLTQYMSNTKLSQLVKPCLITSYDIQKRRTVFFTQHDAIDNPAEDYFIHDVARATSAAPTYFEPAEIKALDSNEFHLVDGGLFANNPTMCAMIEATKVFRTETGDIRRASDFYILSVGTGTVKKPYPYSKAKGWGVIGWVRPLIDIMMSAVSETVDYQLRKLYLTVGLSDQYHRINTSLDEKGAEMDDASPANIDRLMQKGLDCALENDELLESIAKTLVDNKA